MGPFHPQFPTGLLGLFFFVSSSFHIAYSQTNPLFCTAGAVPLTVRAEGLAERLGDILVTCTGGTPGQAVKGNIAVFLPVSITNHLIGDSKTDAMVTVDTGAGPLPAPVSQLLTQYSVSFNGITFRVPSTGGVNIRISNLRAAVTQFGGGQILQAAIALDGLGTLALGNNRPAVAALVPGLLSTMASSGITCVGSPLPASISLSSLFARGTRFASTRVTEGFATAFAVRGPFEDSGTRIVVRYSGFPTGARVFVPDLVAGSNAVEPTAGGDLGLPQSPGRYAMGSSALLFSRVVGADANGAGGVPAFNPAALGSGTVTLASAGEVALVNGSGMVVYEVIASDPSMHESAQFPTFIGLAAVPATGAIARETISLGPISTVAEASASAPVPRYVAVAPPSDCPALRDCDAEYFPSLRVDAHPMQFTAIAGGAAMQPPGYVAIRNEGGGILNWTATVAYKNGADWIYLDNTSGLNGGSVRVWIRPEKLAAGTYQATLTINAGALSGTRTFPITLVVSPAPAPPATPPPQPVPAPPVKPPVTISSVTNAADFRPGPLVAGSLAAIKGSNFSGKTVAVTFDGIAAKLLSTSDTQINLQVPPELGARSSARMIVSVDDRVSDTQVVALASAAPAIFADGIVNEDNSVNGAASPALVGSIIQIYLTGLPASGTGVYVKIHDRDGLEPLNAGPAPTLIGVQQVNVAIPDDLPAMITEVKVCAYGTDGVAVCSQPANLALSAPE